MDLKQEYNQIKKFNYDQLVEYLRDKYGRVPYPYFCNEKCKSKKAGNSRSNEGLYIHHVKENEYINLSQPEIARSLPWEYQLPDNLVYANLIEHSLLHCLIEEEYGIKKVGNDSLRLGSGYFKLTMPFVEDIRDNKNFKLKYRKVISKQIRPYFYILEDIFNRAGYPILSYQEKIKREQNIRNYILIPQYEHIKSLANEYLSMDKDKIKKISRYKLVQYLSELNQIPYDKYNYIDKNRDQIIDELNILAKIIINTKDLDDYLKLKNKTP